MPIPARRHIPFEYLLAIFNHMRSQFSTLARRFFCGQDRVVLCEPCDKLTRSVNGRLEGKSVPPRAPLKSFSLQDEPVDEHGATI